MGLPSGMPPQEVAYCFSLPLPPSFIALSKDLFVFRTPFGPLIEFSMSRFLEPANLPPECCSFEARLVFQNPFDRVV
jgi:hypothetical protein